MVVVASVVVVVDGGAAVVEVVVVGTGGGVVAGVPLELHAVATAASTATLLSLPHMIDTIRNPARPS